MIFFFKRGAAPQNHKTLTLTFLIARSNTIFGPYHTQQGGEMSNFKKAAIRIDEGYQYTIFSLCLPARLSTLRGRLLAPIFFFVRKPLMLTMNKSIKLNYEKGIYKIFEGLYAILISF